MIDLNNAQLLQNSLAILASRADAYAKTSERYKYVNSATLIIRTLELLERIGNRNVETRIVYSSAAGVATTKHLIEFKLLDFQQDLFGTPVIPRILIWNSYNGECSLQINVGVFRLVCSNGLTLGKSIHKQRAVHLIGSEIEQVLESFEDQVATAIDYIQTKMSQDFVGLMGGQLNIWEQARILKVMVERGDISPRLADKITEAVHHPRKEDSEHTMWNFYNIVNETMRAGSRSELAQESKNTDLMSQLILAHSA